MRPSLLAVLTASLAVAVALSAITPVPRVPTVEAEAAMVAPGIYTPLDSIPASLGLEPALVVKGARVLLAPWSLDGGFIELGDLGWPVRAAWSGSALSIAGPKGAVMAASGPIGDLFWVFRVEMGPGVDVASLSSSGDTMAVLYEGGVMMLAEAPYPWGGYDGAAVLVELEGKPLAAAAAPRGRAVVVYPSQDGIELHIISLYEGEVSAYRVSLEWEVTWVCPASGPRPSILVGGREATLVVDLSRGFEASLFPLGFDHCISAYSRSDGLAAVMGIDGLYKLVRIRGVEAEVRSLGVYEGFKPAYIAGFSPVVIGLSRTVDSLSAGIDLEGWGGGAVVTPLGFTAAVAGVEVELIEGRRLELSITPTGSPAVIKGRFVPVSSGHVESECCMLVGGAAGVWGDWMGAALGITSFFRAALEAAELELVTYASYMEGLVEPREAADAAWLLALGGHPAAVKAGFSASLVSSLLEAGSSEGGWQDLSLRALSKAMEEAGVAGFMASTGMLKPRALYDALRSSDPLEASRLIVIAEPHILAESASATRDPSLPSHDLARLALDSFSPDPVEALESFIAMVNGLPGMEPGDGALALPWAAPLALNGSLGPAAAALGFGAVYERALSLTHMAAQVARGEVPKSLPAGCSVYGLGVWPPYASPADPTNIDLHRTTLASHEALLDCGWERLIISVGPPSYIPFLSSAGFWVAPWEGGDSALIMAEVFIDGRSVPRIVVSAGSGAPPQPGGWIATRWEVSYGVLPAIALAPHEGRVIAAVYAGGYKVFLGEPQPWGLRGDVTVLLSPSDSITVDGEARRIPTIPAGSRAYVITGEAAVELQSEAILYTLSKGSLGVVELNPGEYVVDPSGIVSIIGGLGVLGESSPSGEPEEEAPSGGEATGTKDGPVSSIQALTIALAVAISALLAYLLLGRRQRSS